MTSGCRELPNTFSPEATKWLQNSLGRSSCDLVIQRMAGSTSTSVFLIIVSGGKPSVKECFVLRVIDNAEWLAQESDLADHEAAALGEARLLNLPAPKILAHSSRDVGFGAPVVLMSFLEGKIELRPSNLQEWLRELASTLASIHRHPNSTFPWCYSSWLDKNKLIVPEWTRNTIVWKQAFDLLLHLPPPESTSVFLHRDYHPTNVLWDEGRVSGVVDWINACRGPAGVDVAHCRTNLAMMYGPEASGLFLEFYAELVPEFTYHPYWDVDSILDSCLPQPGYYEPWQEFGLNIIEPEVLRERLDEHLIRVIDSTPV